MAGKTSIALRRVNAMERIRAVSAEMGTELGVKMPELPERTKQPELLLPLTLEAIADGLEAIRDALMGTEPAPDAAPTNLSKLNRADLEYIAAERGIADPASFPNKDALIAAIEQGTGDAPITMPVEATETLPEDPDAPINPEPTDEPPIFDTMATNEPPFGPFGIDPNGMDDEPTDGFGTAESDDTE